MNHRSEKAMLLAAALAVVTLSTWPTDATLAQEARAGGQDAPAMFRARCANCHTVPDPELRTDRAWLAQVADTA